MCILLRFVVSNLLSSSTHGFCQSRCELAAKAAFAPHCGSGYKTAEKISKLTFIYPLSLSFCSHFQPHFYTQVSDDQDDDLTPRKLCFKTNTVVHQLLLFNQMYCQRKHVVFQKYFLEITMLKMTKNLVIFQHCVPVRLCIRTEKCVIIRLVFLIQLCPTNRPMP